MTAPEIFYYVRHGESGANVERVLSCRAIDPDLSARGAAQAGEAGEFLAGAPIGPGPILASPMRRAVQTAEIIARRVGRPVRVIEEFREIDVGSFEGRNYDAVFPAWWKILEAWCDGQRDARFPGGEDHFDLTARLRRGFDRIRADGPDGPHIVVAHAGLLRAGFAALAVPPPPVRVKIPNCSVSRLEISDGGARYAFAWLCRSDFLAETTGVSATSGTPVAASEGAPP